MSLPQTAAHEELPPPWPEDERASIAAELARDRRKVWILDDDPTGTQTVANIPVITTWDPAVLTAEFADEAPGCFILTNSRALDAAETSKLHRTLATRLHAAAAGRPYSIISRSDSTLRGHYPLETDALASRCERPPIVLLAPFFAAGGRLTLRDTHYVVEADRLIPAADTPFAQDPVFGYHSSHLPTWIEEKTDGRVPAQSVTCLPLDLIRQAGPVALARVLSKVPDGGVVVANAVDQRDIEVVVRAVLTVEQSGRPVLARTAASFVCARLGQRPPPLLTPAQLQNPAGRGGLVLVGSHVPKTTAQLADLRQNPRITAVELDVPALLNPTTRADTITRAANAMNTVLSRDDDVVVHTSRQLVRRENQTANLQIGATVSAALTQIVQRLAHPPRFLIAKGGITSSDTATHGLGVRRAMVTGQILPGVPVWQLGPETLFPGLNYVVFPGNVGDTTALTQAVAKFNPPLS